MITLEERRRRFAAILALQEEGKAYAAVELLENLEKVDDAPMVRILNATMLPQIYASSEEVGIWRERAMRLLKQLQQTHFTMDLSQSFAVPWFSLAYHGQNDVDAQRLLASLYQAPKHLQYTRGNVQGKQSRIRIGILSTFFRDGHTIGKLAKGLIATLNRDDFFVTVFSFNRKEDETTAFLQDRADAFVELPADIPLARRLIAGQKLDVLYFTDVGMEPITYTLAHTRMATVQCVTWGHPDTTGIETLDYFISSQSLDLPDSQAHYSEKLIRLPHLAVYYYRPLMPALDATRSEFGLPEGCSLYGLPQTLFKLHPNFDPILRGILNLDPTGLLVLLAGNRPGWNEMLLARFSRTMPEVVHRVRFVQRQTYENFLRLNSLFDVLLDPPDFGGGNTSYEAFAMGIPIVTLPSPYLRGRITYALYLAMEVYDCVAESPQHYVELAVKLANEKAFREQVKQKILAAGDTLFENSAGVRDLEAFLRNVCRN